LTVTIRHDPSRFKFDVMKVPLIVFALLIIMLVGLSFVFLVLTPN
jgi:hypothetical protein